MRVRRHKNFRRTLRFFRLAFGIQEPYKVLVDGTFLTHALREKIHVKEQLPKLLSGRATPMVTGCVLAELRNLRDKGLGASIIAKGYYRVKCGHDNPIAAADCIREQVGTKNTRKLLVATQDAELGWALRSVPGVPLIRLNGQVPYVEEASEVSRNAKNVQEERKLGPPGWERPRLPVLRKREADLEEKVLQKSKKRKQKGANPLSCLKPKKRKVAEPASRATLAAQLAPSKPKRVRSRRMGTRRPAEVAHGAGNGPDAEINEKTRTDLSAAAGTATAHIELDGGAQGPHNNVAAPAATGRSRHKRQRRRQR